MQIAYEMSRKFRAVLLDAETRKRLKAARSYADLNQAQLAERLDMSRSTYERIESGRQFKKRPHEWELEGFLRRVAEATGLPYGFFTEPGEPAAEDVSRSPLPQGLQPSRGDRAEPETGEAGGR